MVHLLKQTTYILKPLLHVKWKLFFFFLHIQGAKVNTSKWISVFLFWCGSIVEPCPVSKRFASLNLWYHPIMNSIGILFCLAGSLSIILWTSLRCSFFFSQMFQSNAHHGLVPTPQPWARPCMFLPSYPRASGIVTFLWWAGIIFTPISHLSVAFTRVLCFTSKK